MEKKLGRNDPCWCKSGRKYKACHEQMDDKILMYARKGAKVSPRHIIKTAEQIEQIKELLYD